MATGSTTAIKKAALAKQKATCANRLIPRLAAHLFGTGVYDKQKVRAALVKGGYKGPGWKNEDRAIKILTEAGHDMSGFERLGSAASKIETTKPAKLKNVFVVPEVTDTSVEKLKNATIVLMQAEREIIREFKDGKRKSLGGLVTTVSAALDELRR
jgi:hypothetical protein